MYNVASQISTGINGHKVAISTHKVLWLHRIFTELYFYGALNNLKHSSTLTFERVYVRFQKNKKVT